MQKKYLKADTLEEFFKKILENISQENLKTEVKTLENVKGFYIGEEIISPLDYPYFNRSLVDGYACCASSTFGSSRNSPIILKVAGSIMMGEIFDKPLKENEVYYISTGGMLPDTSDAVIPIENTEELPGEIAVLKSVSIGENVLKSGEDIKKQELLIKKGEFITEKHISILAACGKYEVKVYKKPEIGIISTGNEILDIRKDVFKEGSIWDINSWSIFSILKKFGFKPVILGVVKDDFEDIKNIIKNGIRDYDALIISGGTSKGIKDYLEMAINSIGEPGVLTHGLQISPGKPTISGVINKKFVIGLSGNPLAVIFVLREVIYNILSKIFNIFPRPQKTLYAKLKTSVSSKRGRLEYILVKLQEENGELYAVPLFSESALIGNYLKADGYIKLSLEEEGLEEPSIVKVFLF